MGDATAPKGPKLVEIEQKLEGTDVDYYNNAAKYWENVDGTVDGMLGGFGKVSVVDIDGSNKFLKSLFKLEHGPGKETAIDCGAGIGRITKHLLTKHFSKVDLVEQNKVFLEKARTELASCQNVGDLYCCGLQNFNPEPHKYDVIWCQWVLGHLTDEHLCDFFKRCLTGLKPRGLVIVKENLTSSGTVELDEEDSSVTRPEPLLKEIFVKAGMKIIRELDQKKMPNGLYPVKMFALKKQEDNSGLL